MQGSTPRPQGHSLSRTPPTPSHPGALVGFFPFYVILNELQNLN